MELIKKYAMWLWFALALVVVIVGMIWEGLETNRWGGNESPIITSFGEGIMNIPLSIEGWVGDEETQRDKIENEAISEESGAVTSLSRVYTPVRGGSDYANDFPNAQVEINIICGAAKKLSIHTPTRCYVGSGYKIEGDVETVEIPYFVSKEGQAVANAEAEGTEEFVARFKTAIFTKSANGISERIRVFWAWKTTEPSFLAPTFPRFTWRSATPLCKLYIITPAEKNEDLLQNPIFTFGKVLFPRLDVLLNGNFKSQDLLPDDVLPSTTDSTGKKEAAEEKKQETFELPDLVVEPL